MANNPRFLGVANNLGTIFTSTDVGNFKAIFVSGADGAAVEMINVIFKDVSASGPKDVILRFNQGGTGYQILVASIPPNAGNSSTSPPINLLDPAHWPGLNHEPNRGIVLESGDKLELAVVAVAGIGLVGTNDRIEVVVLGGDY